MSISQSFSVLPKPLFQRPLISPLPKTRFHRVNSLSKNEEINETENLNNNDNNNKNYMYQLIGLLAGIGSLETAYLTFSHFSSESVFCPSWSSCQSVLNSSYSEIFGIPISLFGFCVYATLASLAFYAGSNSNSSKNSIQMQKLPQLEFNQGSEIIPSLESSVNQTVFKNNQKLNQIDKIPLLEKRWNIVQQCIVGCSVLLVSCSTVLLYILFDKVENPWCIWCMFSIFLSTTLGISVWSTLDSREIREALLPSMGIASSVVLSMSFWLSWVDTSQAEVDIPYQKNSVTTESSEQSIQIAKQLKQNGAKMYGAFWCSHCFEQKQMFGKEAVEDLPYVECYPEGYRKGVKMNEDCVRAGLEGFPTWVINGREIQGEQSLEQLEDALNGVEDAGGVDQNGTN